MVSVDSKSVLFASKSKIFEEVKNDAIFFKDMLNNILGDAEHEQDIKELNRDAIKNKISLIWKNSTILLLYFKEEDETIHLSVDFIR